MLHLFILMIVLKTYNAIIIILQTRLGNNNNSNYSYISRRLQIIPAATAAFSDSALPMRGIVI